MAASPDTGQVPLNSVSLTATTAGTSTGNTNYTFYCNRSDTGTNITTPYQAKYDNISQTTRTAFNLCSYSTPGTYTAKVIVERGILVSEARIIIAVTQAPITPTGIPTDYISYWKFEGNAQDEKGVNNGTASGSVSYVIDLEKGGQVLNLNGGYINVGSNISLMPAQFSISSWINLASLPGNGQWYGIFTKGGADSSNGYELYIRSADTGTASNRIMLQLGAASSNTRAYSATIPIVGQWMHVVGTYDGSVLRLYLNGAFNDDGSSGAVLTTNSFPAYIGRRYIGSHIFSGKIDDVIFYNRALSLSEIQNIYNFQKPSTNSPTVCAGTNSLCGTYPNCAACSTGQNCVNNSCQNVQCATGQITSSCYCQGQFRTSGYCCSNVYQALPCGSCTSGQSQSCSTGQQGICSQGTQTCQANGTWGNCVQNSQPATENCSDNLDNDCDGQTDCNDSNCSSSPFCQGSSECTIYVDDCGTTGGTGTVSNPYCRTGNDILDLGNPGSIICLRSGYYGVIDDTGFHNTNYKIIQAEPGHSPGFRRIELNSFSYWKFKGLTISPELTPGAYIPESYIFQMTGTNNFITIEDCTIYSMADSSGWTASDWASFTGRGIWSDTRVSSNITIRNNSLRNVFYGITITEPRSLIEYNTIDGFCADGLRGGAVDQTWQYNLIKNAYSRGTGHRDGMQLYTGQTGFPAYRTVIRGNTFISCENPDWGCELRMMGIGLHQAITNQQLTIENNVVITSHGNGIQVDSPVDSKIANNIVFERYDDSSEPAVIAYGNPMNTIVRNNIAYSLPANSGSVTSDHNIDLDSFNPDVLFIDWRNFNLKSKANSPAIDTGSCINVPTIDKDGVARPQGNSCDIGAYEYQGLTLFESEISNIASVLSAIQEAINRLKFWVK